jgi:methionyl-tRNA formyltransferase
VTGVTIMKMDELLDHGPVLAAREVEIGPGENAAELTERLAEVGADLLVETLARLDQLEPVEQDHDAATVAPKLTREDGELEWDLPAVEIDRRVRAFQPWPGVTLPVAGQRVKVLRGTQAPGSGRPGDILAVGEEGITVAAGEGAYRVDVLQVPGRRPMPARGMVIHDR